MKKKTNFLKLIQRWGIVLILSISVSIIIIDIFISYQEFHLHADQMRNDYVTRQKQIIKREVDSVVDMIKHEKATSESLTKLKIKSRVYEAYSIAQNIYLQNKTTMSKPEIQQMIINALRPIRFEQKTGYYFISQPDGVAQLFPSSPKMEGRNLLDVQDTQGQYITKDMIKIIKQSGEGFYQYRWTKPGNKGSDFKKISFIKQFRPFDWFIGTALYVDDIENSIKKDLLSDISKIRFGKEGYIFVNRLNGDALVSNGKLLNGSKKLWEVFNKNPEKTKQIFKKEHKAALLPGGDYISYSLIKLTAPDKEAKKISYIYGIQDLQWLVSAGVYLDDVEEGIAARHTELDNKNKIKIFFFILVVLGIAAVFLILFNSLNDKLKNDFKLFSSFFRKAVLSDERIDLKQIQFYELEQMGINANRMLENKAEIQQNLISEKERLVSIFEAARNVAFIKTDPTIKTPKIIEFSPGAEYIFGYKSEEIIGKPVSILHLPEDVKKFPEVFKRMKKNKKGFTDESALVKKSGEKFSALFTIHPIFNDSGKMTAALGIAIDITTRINAEEALKESEAKSKALLNAIPDLIFVLDKEGVFLDHHATNMDDLLAPPEMFLGKKFQTILPEEIASPMTIVFERVLTTNQIQSYEYQLPMHGQTNYFAARIIPYGKEKVISIISNITEQKKT